MSIPSPSSPREAIQGALAAHLDEVSAFTRDLTALVSALPERMHHWAIGEEEIVHAVPLESWSGDASRDDSWLELFFNRLPDDGGSHELCAMFADAAEFTRSAQALGSVMTRADMPYHRVRTLIQAPLAPGSAPDLSDYFDSGGDAREHSSLPLFLCVDSAGHVAFADGPDAIVLLRSPLLAGAAGELFRRLWTTGRSLPHRKHRHEWSPLLQLLFQGETLESASHRLRYTPRTARRRVDAAYAHYGVNTLFALGVAWGANVAEAAPQSSDEGSA